LIAAFFGADVTYAEVKDAVRTDRDGTAEDDIVRFLRAQRLRCEPRSKLTFAQLVDALRTGGVVLVGLDGDHYGVVHAYDEDEDEVYLADPSIRRQLGTRTSVRRFKERWMRDGVIVRLRRSRRARSS
jgi:ABC-type bacteriocin/lantibiotic exporter with double-glycine peptidase domain